MSRHVEICIYTTDTAIIACHGYNKTGFFRTFLSIHENQNYALIGYDNCFRNLRVNSRATPPGLCDAKQMYVCV